jgi:hypothetical protein
MTFCLEKCTGNGVKMKRAEGRANVTPALEHNQPVKEVGNMSRWDQYTESDSVFKPNYLTADYNSLRDSLESRGWKTPQTYAKSFDCAGDFSAVYAFLLVDRWDFSLARVAYVGMSTRLSQRWSGHSVLSELNEFDDWVQKWFLRVPEDELRATEAKYINEFDPPWNVIGRKSGVCAL